MITLRRSDKRQMKLNFVDLAGTERQCKAGTAVSLYLLITYNFTYLKGL